MDLGTVQLLFVVLALRRKDRMTCDVNSLQSSGRRVDCECNLIALERSSFGGIVNLVSGVPPTKHGSNPLSICAQSCHEFITGKRIRLGLQGRVALKVKTL